MGCETCADLRDLIAELEVWPVDLPLGPRMKRLVLDQLRADLDHHADDDRHRGHGPVIE